MRSQLTFVLLFTLPFVPAFAQTPDSVDAFIDALNQALRGDAAGVAPLFADDAEYSVGGRTVATGPKAIAQALAPPAFSEQTHPHLEAPEIFPLTSEYTVIFARLVSYGSLILKQARAVLLLLRDTGEGWRIASWSSPPAPLFPMPVVRFQPR